MQAEARTVNVGEHVRADVLVGEAEQFVGLGGVWIDGVAVRSPARPLVLRIDTPEGILYTRYIVEDIRAEADGATAVVLRAVGIPWGRREYCDEYNQQLIDVEAPVEPVVDTVTLLLRPAQLELGGRPWQGFSYAVRYESPSREIHRILVHGTWEIGGAVTGNTVLNRGQVCMPVYKGSAESVFTTACLKRVDLYGDDQGMSFQLGPRGGLLQAFDFQYAGDGALLMYWPGLESISSIVESPPGSDLLHVIDEERFELSGSVTTTPKHVLFAPGSLTEEQSRDLWWAAHEYVYGGICDVYGVEPTLARPMAGGGGGTGRLDGERILVTIGGEEVESTDVPYAFADNVLPKFAAQGFRRFMAPAIRECDVSVLGKVRKLDEGLHGDLHCASVCATHRFQPAELWGGMKGWRYMAEKARALGIEVGTWFAPHFSPRAAIFEEHPDWAMIGADTRAIGGGYGWHTLRVADWNTGIYDWVLADMKRWQEEGGLDYIFVDSWANLSLLQVNFAARMRTNFARLGQLLADLQKVGIKAISFEGISPFGISRFGMQDLRGDLLEGQAGVAGQNDFGWWVGHEDMAYDFCAHVQERKRAPEELERIQFRLMANRGYAMFDDIQTGPVEWPDWFVRLNHTYNQALPHMRVRRMLPEGAGVSWSDDSARIVWAYRDLELPVGKGVTAEMLDGELAAPIAHEGTIRLGSRTVCRLTGIPPEAELEPRVIG